MAKRLSGLHRTVGLLMVCILICELLSVTCFFKKKKKNMIILGHGCGKIIIKEDKKGEMIIMNGHDCHHGHGHEEHHHHHHHHGHHESQKHY